jgi:hypothetical protein
MLFRIHVVIIALLVAVSVCAVQAGPVLDDLLNYPIIDQICPADTTNEGLGLVSKGLAQFAILSKANPIGQTFKLSDNATVLWRVHVGLCHWPDHWKPGEAVTFTLWDSPAKKFCYYSRTLDYHHKWFKWDVVFDTYLPVKGGQEFYLELTHNGGDDDKLPVVFVPGDQYPVGQGYSAGQPQDWDLYFVAIAKRKPDKDANLKRFFDNFDFAYPPLAAAGKAVADGDYESAFRLILDHFANRKGEDALVREPKQVANPDTRGADAICDEGRVYRSIDEREIWMPMGPETTWREVWPESADYVRMNNVFADLGNAYLQTGNEKYAAKLNELMADYMQDNASPFEGGMRGGRWVAMFQAWRLGDAWDGWGAAFRSKSLTDDVKLAWIDYWCRMADFAQREHSGGNHANAVGQALMQFAARFPELRRAKEWFSFGFDKLVSNSLELFYDDGACREPTMNYHGYSLANLMSGLEIAKKFKLAIPDELTKRLEKALSYTAYMLDPRGQIPSNGDTNCANFLPNANVWDGWRKGEAMKCYQMFGRKDCLFIATAGKQGTRPKVTSYRFPDIKYAVMRSDWGGEGGKDFEQARMLWFRGGSIASHGHEDLNSIVAYAYGRPLLIDPGRTDYDDPLMPELVKSRSHNVLLCDDFRMNHASPNLHAWHATPVIDFIDNSYTELYPGVEHRRAVVFVRPDYWVVFDRASGNAAHKYGINFWLTPPAKIEPANATAFSCDPEGSNLLVKVLNPNGVETTQRKGTLDLHGHRSDIPVVTFWKSGQATATFTTLLTPFPKGATPANVTTRHYSDASGEVCTIQSQKRTDYVFYSREPKYETKHKSSAFKARVALVRTQGLSVQSFGLLEGTVLRLNGKVLATSNNPVDELSVVYRNGVVEVTCPKPEPTLEIARLGCAKAVVNGKKMSIAAKQPTFKPFK